MDPLANKPEDFCSASTAALMKPLSAIALAVVVCAGAGCGDAQSGAPASEATMVDLNRAVAAMTMMNGRCPATVSELTNFPVLRGKTLPVPPAGKKLVIDPATRQVILAEQ